MENQMIMTMKFTCIGKGHGAPCLPATKEDWEALLARSSRTITGPLLMP